MSDRPELRDDVCEPARLRARLYELARRRDRAVERVARFSVNERQLEAMRFELAELEWRLAELEGGASRAG